MALTPKQLTYASLIMQGSTKERAAKAVGVTPRAARGWHGLKEFQDHVAASTRELEERASLLMASLLLPAVATLGEMLKSDQEPQIRLAAAKAILDRFLAVKSQSELSEEIESIKALLGARETHRNAG